MKAVITGGVKGLGKAFAEFLLNKGYTVYAIYHTSLDEAYDLEMKYDNVRCIKCDIRNESEVEQLFFNIDDIDLVINNASIAIDNELKDKTGKEFLNVLNTNVVGTFLVSKYALSKLSKKGIIINISSNNSLDNYNPISMDYDVSKCGVNMLTKEFALLTDKKVLCYAPGWINTDAVKEMNPKYVEKEMKKVNQLKIIEPSALVENILTRCNNDESGSIIEIKEV